MKKNLYFAVLLVITMAIHCSSTYGAEIFKNQKITVTYADSCKMRLGFVNGQMSFESFYRMVYDTQFVALHDGIVSIEVPWRMMLVAGEPNDGIDDGFTYTDYPLSLPVPVNLDKQPVKKEIEKEIENESKNGLIEFLLVIVQQLFIIFFAFLFGYVIRGASIKRKQMINDNEYHWLLYPLLPILVALIIEKERIAKKEKTEEKTEPKKEGEN
jgi:hypothetical protein